MEKKGFFKLETRTLSFIGIVILFEILMFSPMFYYSIASTGTAYPFIGVNIILCIVPMLGLVEGYFRGKAAAAMEARKLGAK